MKTKASNETAAAQGKRSNEAARSGVAPKHEFLQILAFYAVQKSCARAWAC